MTIKFRENVVRKIDVCMKCQHYAYGRSVYNLKKEIMHCAYEAYKYRTNPRCAITWDKKGIDPTALTSDLFSRLDIPAECYCFCEKKATCFS